MDNRVYFLEALLNKNYLVPLQMVNSEGENFSFEKIGVKKYIIGDKEYLYCLLKLLDNVDDIEKNRLLLYRVNESNNKISLRYEENQHIMHDILATKD